MLTEGSGRGIRRRVAGVEFWRRCTALSTGQGRCSDAPGFWIHQGGLRDYANVQPGSAGAGAWRCCVAAAGQRLWSGGKTGRGRWGSGGGYGVGDGEQGDGGCVLRMRAGILGQACPGEGAARSRP